LLYQAIIVPILAGTFINKDAGDLRTIIVIADIDEGLNQ